MSQPGNNLDDIIEACNENLKDTWDFDYILLAQRFVEWEKSAPADQKHIWRLLVKACYMNVQCDSDRAYYVPTDRISEFSEKDLTLFSEMVPDLLDCRLRSRLADILWESNWKERRDRYSMAEIAIESYKHISFDCRIWAKYGHRCFARLLYLMFRVQRDEDNLSAIQIRIRDEILSADEKEYAYIIQMSDLFLKHAPQSFSLEVASKLEKIARDRENAEEFRVARLMYAAAYRWYKHGKNDEKATEMEVCQADIYFSESRLSGAIVGRDHLNNALRIYKGISQNKREKLGIYKKIKQCEESLAQLRMSLPSEMGTISRVVDVTKFAKEAEKKVSGKSALESLKQFVTIWPFLNYEQIKNNSKPSYLVATLVNWNHYSHDGRLVRSKYATSNEPDAQNIHSAIMRYYCDLTGLITYSRIIPALHVIQNEHRLSEDDFYNIVENTPCLPLGHARLFAKGLYSGFIEDYITSLHILAPQFENFIRSILHTYQANTITRDKDGYENEKGLGSLVENPELADILGKDVVFEIQACFCDPYGPNVRNNIAHGLNGYEQCNSGYYVYAWWLIFKVIVLWNISCNVNTLDEQ